MTETARPARDAPDIVGRPPLLFLASIALGAVLQRLLPLRLLPDGWSVLPGAALVAVAVVLFAWAIRTLRAAGTGIRKHQPTTTIVTGGPYRWSRNPIYLAFTLCQLGIALWANGAWLLATLVPTLVVVRYGVIAREEAYLERKFGPEYLRYRQAVGRWL